MKEPAAPDVSATLAAQGAAVRTPPATTRASRLRRGAAILPSLFTMGNIFLGFLVIVKTMHGAYAEAAPLIFGAIVLDMLDGRIARLTNTTSEFGAELDSLADIISFGVAPACLAYAWAFSTMPDIGWPVAFLFVAAGAVRLARFNVQRSVTDGRSFVGLPIPAAAGQVAAWVSFVQAPLVDRGHAIIALAFLIVLSFLMVSTFRYTSFKKIDLRRRYSSFYVLGIALLFLLIALNPRAFLLVGASGYWLSGPVGYLLGLLQRRRAAPNVPVAEVP